MDGSTELMSLGRSFRVVFWILLSLQVAAIGALGVGLAQLPGLRRAPDVVLVASFAAVVVVSVMFVVQFGGLYWSADLVVGLRVLFRHLRRHGNAFDWLQMAISLVSLGVFGWVFIWVERGSSSAHVIDVVLMAAFSMLLCANGLLSIRAAPSLSVAEFIELSKTCRTKPSDLWLSRHEDPGDAQSRPTAK
jgi:hypothetical protein